MKIHTDERPYKCHLWNVVKIYIVIHLKLIWDRAFNHNGEILINVRAF